MHSAAGLAADKEGKTMKETYVKPAIFIERFSLTQNIASGCGDYTSAGMGVPTTGDNTNCAWDMGGLTLFVSSPICNRPVGKDEIIESICYNAPSSNASVFASM